MSEEAEYMAMSLSLADGRWQEFQADWKAQCDEAGEAFEDYAPDVTEILRQIAAGEVEQTGIKKTSVCGVREGETGRFWAVAMLNWVKHLPGSDEPVVRVRHLLASPRLDYGLEELDKYAEVLVNALSGFITVTKEHFASRHLHFHLRSPADINFFAALGANMAKHPMFERVERRGAWLYITLVAGENGSDTQPES